PESFLRESTALGFGPRRTALVETAEAWGHAMYGRTLVLGFILASIVDIAWAENIDPADDTSQYAWAENIGWLNAEPSGDGGPGVQVGDSQLSGWMWGENMG